MTQTFKIGEIWNFLLAFVFQISSSNAQIWVFWGKTYKVFHFLVQYLWQYLCWFQIWQWFSKTWAQMPKFWHFPPKSINFLIITTFRMYSISNVLVSNLAFLSKIWTPNAQIWAKFCLYTISKVLTSNLTFAFCASQ